MGELLILVGAPASGKSTWTKAGLADGSVDIRVNRDDIRAMLWGDADWSSQKESIAVAARDAAIRAGLRAGLTVAVDDTNTSPRVRDRLEKIALECGVKAHYVDFSDVPVDECVRRNSLRPNPVPESVIHAMDAELDKSWRNRVSKEK